MKLDDAIEEYTDFVGTPSYEDSVQSMFTRAGPFLKERKVTTVADITVRDCREFSKELARSVQDGDISKSSAVTYFDVFRAWLAFCVRDEMIDDNPAATHRAQRPLPDPKGNEQQFWSTSDREKILEAVDAYVSGALDKIDTTGWALPFRNRALTYTLSYSGTRISEVVASSRDEERTGIKWSDVDLKDGSVRVFGKNRQYESMQLPSPAAAVLDEYKRIVDPVTEQWAVFPTAHAPTLYKVAREQLAARGLDEDAREELLAEREIFDVYRQEKLAVPSMTVSGFREGFWKDFVDEHDLYINGERPEFHAARRGLGDELYRENPRLAQSALRHNDLRTTHEAYSHIQASETASEVDDTLALDEPKSFLEEVGNGAE